VASHALWAEGALGQADACQGQIGWLTQVAGASGGRQPTTGGPVAGGG